MAAIPLYFEEGFSGIREKIGLSFQDFTRLPCALPIVQFHIDYHQPLRLDEEFTVRLLHHGVKALNC